MSSGPSRNIWNILYSSKLGNHKEIISKQSKVNNIMENRNYAKLVDGKIQYAPRKFIENGCLIVPREIDDDFHFNKGYFKVIDVKPHYDYATQNISILKWNIDEIKYTITSVYIVNENPSYSKQVRKFSKLKITLFCIENKIWQDVKEYLEKIGYYDLFVMA
jgi:hypothetical protein